MPETAKDFIDRFRQKEAARKVWDGHFQDVAELCYTKAADFTGKVSDGEKRERKIFDTTAPQALQQYAAAAISYTAPGTKQWHGLRHPLDEAMEDQEIAEWYEKLTATLFRYRYSGRSAFQSQLFETFLAQGAFGTGGVFIGSDERPEQNPLWYRSIPLSQLYMSENAQGQIDQIDRRTDYTARQAKQMFGDRLPERIDRAARTEPMRTFTFVHCVAPNGDYEPDKADHRGMAFRGVHVCVDEEKIVEDGGYRKLPYAVTRFVTAAGETYGRGPGMNALPSIQVANAIMRSYQRGTELRAEPPLLLYKDGTLSKFRLAPAAFNPGGLNAQGQQLVQSLQLGSGPERARDILELLREDIRAAFLMNLFQILVQRPADTATAALLRDQEKGALLGPQLGRTSHEFFGPLIEREIDILAHLRKLPPPPEQLKQYGLRYDVEYVSPLIQLQAVGEALALQQVLSDITPLAQVDPTILKRIDRDEVLKGVAKARGLPLRYLLSDDDLRDHDEAEAERQQAAALAQGAPVMAGTLKDLAQAQKFTADAAAAGG